MTAHQETMRVQVRAGGQVLAGSFSPTKPGAERERTLRYAAGCAVLFVVCVLVARPWAEIAMVDDWSYIRSAQVLAQTGHVVYNGWATAMMGWQLYAGALMIKLFGMSFTAPRMSTLVIATLTVAVMQRTLVRFGVGERNAAIATLTMALSPMYMQLSASFMSDVQGFFALVTCLYLCVRALQSETDRAAIVWVCAAALSNAVLGSCRQVAWLGVLAMVPSTLWLLRRRTSVVLAGGVANFVGVVVVFLTLHWYGKKPYALSDTRNFHYRNWHLPRIANQETQAVLLTLFLVLPLLLAFVPSPRVAKARFWMVALGALVAQIVFHVVSRNWEHGFVLSFPYLPNWLTVFGHFTTEAPLLPSPPVILTRPVLVVVNTVFDVGLIFTAACVVRRMRDRVRTAEVKQALSPGLSWNAIGVLLVPFLIVYYMLLVPRAADSLTDRYIIPLAWAAALCLARLWQERSGELFPRSVVVALVLIALYGVAANHDFYACYRAKAAMFHEIQQSGVADNQIEGGWDLDGWTELQHAAYLNDSRIRTPRDAYQPKQITTVNPCMFAVYEDLFPHMDPLYGIWYARDGVGGPAPFAPVSYTQWLRLGKSTTLYAVRCQR